MCRTCHRGGFWSVSVADAGVAAGAVRRPPFSAGRSSVAPFFQRNSARKLMPFLFLLLLLLLLPLLLLLFLFVVFFCKNPSSTLAPR